MIGNKGETEVRCSYDPVSRRTGITRGNSTSSALTYDWASRLLSLTQNLAFTAHDVTFGFGYTAAGQLMSRSHASSLYVWTAPTLNRAYVPDGLNRYTSVAGVWPDLSIPDTAYTHSCRSNCAGVT